MLLLCILAVLLLAGHTYSSDIPNFNNLTDKQILDYLSDPIRYDPRMRPQSHTIINVTVLLLSLSSPDESSLSYEVEFLLVQTWYDHRLRYSSKGDSYPFLNALHHVETLWIPDTYFIKHGDFKHPLLPVHMTLRVQENGTVTYVMRRAMVVNCQGNLEIFPFDNPKCPFAIESVSHESHEMELQWTEGRPHLGGATSLRYHNAYLVKNNTGDCDTKHTWRGNYSCLKVLLVFTRDKSFYFSTVFVPGMVLVASSFISFWLDYNAVPARVMLGVTTMLNFCTTTNSFRGTLPVVSNLTAMNMWDGVCMFFIYASMLEFIVVNYIFRMPPHGRRPSIAPPSSELMSKSSTQNQIGSRWNSPGAQYEGASSPAKEIGESFSPERSPVENVSKPRPTFSVLTWIRKPLLIDHTKSRQHLSKKIDNISKALFPLLFGLFVFTFFLTFAIIKPNQRENWFLMGP